MSASSRTSGASRLVDERGHNAPEEPEACRHCDNGIVHNQECPWALDCGFDYVECFNCERKIFGGNAIQVDEDGIYCCNECRGVYESLTEAEIREIKLAAKVPCKGIE